MNKVYLNKYHLGTRLFFGRCRQLYLLKALREVASRRGSPQSQEAISIGESSREIESPVFQALEDIIYTGKALYLYVGQTQGIDL